MKFIKFLIVGILFGIVMAKSQALSWYRIQEMFRFQSFHMYGIIGTAVVLGVIGTALIKRFNWKDVQGNPINFAPKETKVKMEQKNISIRLRQACFNVFFSRGNPANVNYFLF